MIDKKEELRQALIELDVRIEELERERNKLEDEYYSLEEVMQDDSDQKI
jgi:hypothetical protein